MVRFTEALNAAQPVGVDGRIVIPENYHLETNIIIPDAIVEYCLRRYELAKPGIRTVDPMCGVGTIPRVINKAGGDCLGIELDKERYEAAARTNQPGSILHGDLTELLPKQGQFDCIFTSMPFSWFRNEKSAAAVNPIYAQIFADTLKPTGFILLDSLPEVERNGENWPVASLEDQYFSRNGFVLDSVISFNNDEHVDTSNQSVIMKFVNA